MSSGSGVEADSSGGDELITPKVETDEGMRRQESFAEEGDVKRTLDVGSPIWTPTRVDKNVDVQGLLSRVTERIHRIAESQGLSINPDDLKFLIGVLEATSEAIDTIIGDENIKDIDLIQELLGLINSIGERLEGEGNLGDDIRLIISGVMEGIGEMISRMKEVARAECVLEKLTTGRPSLLIAHLVDSLALRQLDSFLAERTGTDREIIHGMFEEFGWSTDDEMWNPDIFLNSFPEWVITPSRFSRGNGLADRNKLLLQEIKVAVASEVQSNPKFFFNQSFRWDASAPWDMRSTLLTCPCSIGIDSVADLRKLGIEHDKFSDLLRLRYYFIYTSKLTMMNWAERQEGKNSDSYHRQAYGFGQQTALLSKSADPDQSYVPIYDMNAAVRSPRYFREMDCPDEEKRKLVDSYIRSTLYLLLPDKQKMNSENSLDYIVQEEFITVDLIALAEEYGLMSVYEDVFRAIKHLRKCYFWLYVDLRPDLTQNQNIEHAGRKMSILDVVREFLDKNNRLPGTCIDFGGGKKFYKNSPRELSEFLLQLGLFREVHTLDVDEEADQCKNEVSYVEVIKDVCAGDPDLKRKFVVHLAGTKKYTPEMVREEKNFLLSRLPKKADIILLGDVLHETHNGLLYFFELLKRLNEGGYLVGRDPTYSQILDSTMSTVSLIHYDRFPRSVTSAEEMQNFIAIIQLLGFEICSYQNIPGVLGYNDHLWRNSFVIKKSKEKGTIRYAVPEGGGDMMCSLNSKMNFDDNWEEISHAMKEIFPLTCLEGEDLAFLLEAIRPYIEKAIKANIKAGLPAVSLRKILFKCLYSLYHELDDLPDSGTISKVIKGFDPYAWLAEAEEFLKKKIGDDAADAIVKLKVLRQDAKYGGLLLTLLKKLDLNININEVPSWKGFTFNAL